ncbi:MAG: NADH-quinone oxidoreductase subunit NuoG [Anaerolineae bacterium]|nr:NADH-quinone oxidoreductase subunit NuoG [Anaerolineae bacterium]
MSETVTIYLDDRAIEAPKGMNLVDACKLHGVDIPVFCYHPKMEPVGMCRMCLIELGFEQRDRTTGEVVLGEDGKPLVRWFPTLQTACTQVVSEGMHVRTTTEAVRRGRKDIIEFILTSHPLDCPVCDKGGECPLQELTMDFGPGKSRFLYDEKIHLAKRYPLGEQIYLDRERCIQCARCIRYVEEITDDPVLQFYERGRRLQIISTSEPGFDSKFSGNTTDICPVGALTTADFRFGARPWELDSAASICTHCPVGCNLTLNTRLDRDAGGRVIIKRVMPRQNEQVNEIWICDKGRFGHHFTAAPDRITTPLVRKGGKLVEATWSEALELVAGMLKSAGKAVGALAGPTLSNEDLWALRRLVEGQRGARLGVWPPTMTGGDLIAEVGVAQGTNFTDMGKGACIVVVASDLEEEAPIYWHRVKVAADRGATLVVVNGRATKLDRYTRHRVRYHYGDEVATLNGLLRQALGDAAPDIDGFDQLRAALENAPAVDAAAAQAIAGATDLVVIVGGEGLSMAAHGALMQAAANLLVATGHVGRPNNGLLAVWPGANTQGALDMGFTPEDATHIIDNAASFEALIIAGADPADEDPRAAAALQEAGFIVATALFLTPTAELADVVLPRMSFAERDGTFTNGERRVQRFCKAIDRVGESRADWQIFQQVGAALGQGRAMPTPGVVMAQIVERVPWYAGMDYPTLAEVAPQFPMVGGEDLYYGGTMYKNAGGLGRQWAVAAEQASYQARVRVPKAPAAPKPGKGELIVVPVRLLYDQGTEFYKTQLVHRRVPQAYVALNAGDAARLSVREGARVRVRLAGTEVEVAARVRASVPEGVALLPLNLGVGPLPHAASVGTVAVAEAVGA